MPPLISSPCPVPGCERPVRRAGLCEPHAREGTRLLILRPATPPRPHALRILRALDRAARVDELEARLLDSDRQREAMAERIARMESAWEDAKELFAQQMRGSAARVDELEAEVAERTGRILACVAIHARDAARDAARIAELEAEVERARLDGEIQCQAQTAREIEGYARAGDQAAELQAEIERLREQLREETERRVAAERSAKGADALAEAVWKLKGRPEVEQLRTPGGMRRAA